MKNNNQLTIGLFGFGVVGTGLYQVLADTHNANVSIKTACVRDLTKDRGVRDIQFTENRNEILKDPEINLVVELIDDAESAYHIVKDAMLAGKSVVSANKKMLAYHLDELIRIQKEHDVALLYDASACGSIPIIRNLEEYYDVDLLQSVTGILNGSSNYILTRIFNEGQSFDEALAKAQELGFAESDPVSDVGGFDSLYKLVIITLHSFGVIIDPDKVLNLGMQNIQEPDIRYAREKDCKIKLIAQVSRLNGKEICLWVMPRLISREKYTYNVDDEYNGVVIKGKFYDKQFMFGKGAGGTPTATSVLSDISARSFQYKYEYKKRIIHKDLIYNTDVDIDIYFRYSDPADLALLTFTEVYERHQGREYHYITGRINLQKLLAQKQKLDQLNVFIAGLTS